MARSTTLLSFALIALAANCGVSLAQGFATGGPIANSTGIGSGIGPGTGPGSTAPSFPNFTRDAPPPMAIPPGGLAPVGRLGGSPSFTRRAPDPVPSRYLAPRDPFDPTVPRSVMAPPESPER